MNVSFDWNDWFSIFSSAIMFALFLLIKKYFPPVIVILIWVFNSVYVSSVDYFLSVSPFHLYYFGDNPTFEMSAVLFHLFMYPCASLLFLYGYDKGKLDKKKRLGTFCFGQDLRCFSNGFV